MIQVMRMAGRKRSTRVRGFSRGLNIEEYRQKKANSVFEDTAARRHWEVFAPVTPDIGTDYMILKRWAKLQIQLKAPGLGKDGQHYSIHFSKVKKDPDHFFIYLIIHVKVDSSKELDAAIEKKHYDFYIIPTTHMTKELEPWKKAFPTETWRTTGKYNSNLTLSQIEESWRKYKGKGGWQLLQERTKRRVCPKCSYSGLL
jgi:hypothetical protein